MTAIVAPHIRKVKMDMPIIHVAHFSSNVFCVLLILFCRLRKGAFLLPSHGTFSTVSRHTDLLAYPIPSDVDFCWIAVEVETSAPAFGKGHVYFIFLSSNQYLSCPRQIVVDETAGYQTKPDDYKYLQQVANYQQCWVGIGKCHSLS